MLSLMSSVCYQEDEVVHIATLLINLSKVVHALLLFESIVIFYFLMNSSQRAQDEPAEDVNGNEEPSFVDGASFSQLGTNDSSRSTSDQITVDAVHPFFTNYRNIQTYYCRECHEDFETSPKSLKHHFMSKVHTPVSSCTYCHLPTYEYIHNGNCLIYHRCEEELPRTGGEGDTIDVSDNLLNSSVLDESSSNISQSSNTNNSSVSDLSTENSSV